MLTYGSGAVTGTNSMSSTRHAAFATVCTSETRTFSAASTSISPGQRTSSMIRDEGETEPADDSVPSARITVAESDGLPPYEAYEPEPSGVSI